ncbi:hypothetical protein X777_04122 [Ooceraea biroi]|uniref:Uncharacterized protein n=1 Tax=Ooceraea biroi TaxID=2015173 RepID=A0A026WIU3_OOCBI|nr:hypothetical protein X777_04122 [Ooceraea biroi]
MRISCEDCKFTAPKNPVQAKQDRLEAAQSSHRHCEVVFANIVRSNVRNILFGNELRHHNMEQFVVGSSHSASISASKVK